MTKFDISVYMNGCHLIIDVVGGNQNMYQVLLNEETKDVSEFVQWTGNFEYDLSADGIYKLYMIEGNDISLQDNKLRIGAVSYTVEEFIDAVESGIVGFNNAKLDTDEIFCNCKLKKCLLNLQMKVFREMLKNCGSIRCKNDELKAQRDFLFIANWLMEHLAEEDKVEQLHNIYEGILSCGSICDDLLDNKNCGCNG